MLYEQILRRVIAASDEGSRLSVPQSRGGGQGGAMLRMFRVASEVDADPSDDLQSLGRILHCRLLRLSPRPRWRHLCALIQHPHGRHYKERMGNVHWSLLDCRSAPLNARRNGFRYFKKLISS